MSERRREAEWGEWRRAGHEVEGREVDRSDGHEVDGPYGHEVDGSDGPEADGPEADGSEARWPLSWQGLRPHERWLWFEQLWSDACMLHDRYRLPLRSGWWEDQLQVEALAAFASWVARYDSEEWDDPPGKLALLYDLDRLSELLRDGRDPFCPERDRAAFTAHLIELGCRPPPAAGRGAH
jgi:hypothetical protein